MSVSIEVAHEATPELLAALNTLVPQLTGHEHGMDAAALARMLGQSGLTLLVARDEERPRRPIVGTATLIVVDQVSERRAHLEDVVVDAGARGQGIGELLTREVVRRAADGGAASLNLTSSPRREAANRLYQRLGFERRETNVYRLVLNP